MQLYPFIRKPLSTISRKSSNQRGMALVLTLLILATASIIAVGINTDSTIEIKIGANQKDKIFSFTYGDFAAQIAPMIIEDNIYHSGWSNVDARWDSSLDPPAYRYTPSSMEPFILVYKKSFSDLGTLSTKAILINCVKQSDGTIDITAPGGAFIDVSKKGGLAPGSAIQMAAGYEGIGKGSGGGGYHAFYHFDCDGEGINQARSKTEMYYRHVSKP